VTYEAVIGLEVHVQLDTSTKLFCADAVTAGAAPNTQVCPLCLGLPGALPVLNATAVDLAVRAALALGCTVHPASEFDRKSYFYPDLPKGYQITQPHTPLATAGRFEGVRIRRVHIEEDAGRLLHDRIADCTAIDLNRAGVPLIEIVTEPDLRDPSAARAFLMRLRRTLKHLAVSDCEMENASLRVDANVSIRPSGSRVDGARTEVKNLNSFAHVERALSAEIERQVAGAAAGRSIDAGTLLWDAARGRTRRMRAKEASRDYRYHHEPDVPTLRISAERIAGIRERMPELPVSREARYAATWALPAYDIEVLTADPALAGYFEAVAARVDAKQASNWIMTEVLGWVNRHGSRIEDMPVGPAALAELIGLVGQNALSRVAARRVFELMADTGGTARDIAEEYGLTQVSDDASINEWLDRTLAAFPDEVARYRAGEARVMTFLIGQLMKMSAGTADPRRAAELLRARLEA
jgi:aspartyl-tRNA(Asn)/glutamyl-tRNA(Gln) amidotransferase subunit B